MMDRRRINGPSGGTSTPVYVKRHGELMPNNARPERTRAPNMLRKMCMMLYFIYKLQANPV